MRVFSSGWQAGLQGLSDTLGGAAQFEREGRVLAQRQKEEERRQQAFDLDLQRAQNAVSREQAADEYSFAMANQEASKRREALFQQMMGGPPTVDQAAELERLQALTSRLKPENADLFLRQFRAEKAQGMALQGLTQLSEEVMRPVTEGSVQDPGAQQQLGMIQQALAQLGQQVQAGAVPADDVPRYVDQAMERQQAVLKDYAKRQADLQVRQATIQQIEMHKQGLTAGDPRLQRLTEMQQLAGVGMMTPQQVGTKLIQEQFGVSDDEVQAYELIAAQKQQALAMQAMTDPAGAVRGMAEFTRMKRPAPKKSLEGLRSALKNTKDKSPEALDRLLKRFGIEDLSPEEEAALFGE